MQDAEMIAQELSALGHRLDELEKRLAGVEVVNTRLEEAALTTSRALGEISGPSSADESPISSCRSARSRTGKLRRSRPRT
jgi:hypothetical protein